MQDDTLLIPEEWMPVLFNVPQSQQVQKDITQKPTEPLIFHDRLFCSSREVSPVLSGC